MDKKWYNLFVSVESPEGAPAEKAAAPQSKAAPKTAPSAARTVAEIAASAVKAEPKFATPVHNPASFEEVYSAAEIRPPVHGYTIFKVAEMLQSEHIRNLAVEVKRSSVLVALDAAGVKLPEVIEDAVRRDRALDAFERVQQKSLEELEARKAQENRQAQAELDKITAEHRARMKANDDEVARAKERFYGWRLKKQEEEQRIADAVAPFVSENPITTGGAGAGPSPAPKPKVP